MGRWGNRRELTANRSSCAHAGAHCCGKQLDMCCKCMGGKREAPMLPSPALKDGLQPWSPFDVFQVCVLFICVLYVG